MIDISKKIKNALKSGLVAKKNCEYYPCHFDGQDCTWCFCPFYPCLGSATEGKFTVSRRTGKKVWSCIDCRWVHERRVAEKVLTELCKHVRPKAAIRRRILGDGHEG